MPDLTATFQELFEAQREQEWRNAGVPEDDIAFSRLCGMNAFDVRTFRTFSRGGLLIVVRCPKRAARPWHGVFPAKTMATKAKSGSAGIAENKRGQLFVSDYDLMCVWRFAGPRPEKIVMSARDGAPRGPWSPEAQRIAVELNKQLVSRVQHGCQDDFADVALNPGLKPSDHFAAFRLGTATYLANPEICRRYYAMAGLFFPYGLGGNYLGPAGA